jgi:uncharacterized protein
MLLFRPIFGDTQRSLKPENQDEAAAISPNISPMYADPADLKVTVQAHNGEILEIDDPALLCLLREGLPERHHLRLMSSQRAMTDCRPISIFSTQTAQKIGDKIESSVDKRRFRANIYLDLPGEAGFAEDQFVGKSLQIGAKVVVAVLSRDSRCKIITLDPNSTAANPEVMKFVSREHDGKAGVYAAVLVEGTIHSGDEVVLLS